MDTDSIVSASQDRTLLGLSRRTLRACVRCHAKKVRCDGQVPCDICRESGSECNYGAGAKRRGPKKGYMTAIQLRLQRLESLLGGLLLERKIEDKVLDDLVHGHDARKRLETGQAFYRDTPWAVWTGSWNAKGKEKGKRPLDTLEESDTDIRDKSGDEDDIADENRRSMPWRRSRSLDPASDSGTKDNSSRQVPDVLGQLSMDENRTLRYHGKASGLYMVAPSSTRFRDYTWQFPKPTHWPQTGQTRLWTEADLLEKVGLVGYLPDRRIQKHLLDLYFAYIHPTLPIINKEIFYESWLQEDPVRRPCATLLFAIFAFAAKYSSWRSVQARLGQFYSAGDQYYDAAKKCLDYDSDNSRLSSVQAHLLLAMREQGTGRSTAAWNHSGSAVRMAQDLGLMRESSKWAIPQDKLATIERNSRNRIFWGCNVVEKNVSAWIGRPVAIFDKDYDAYFVHVGGQDRLEEEEQSWQAVPAAGIESEPEDLIEALEENSMSAAAGSTSNDSKSENMPWYRSADYVEPADYMHQSLVSSQKSYILSTFRAQSQLSEIIGQIMQSVYPIQLDTTNMTQEVILTLLNSHLTSWFIDLPKHLAYDSSAASSRSVPPPHILTLHMMYYVALILLHRPFIPAGSGRTLSPLPSLQICISAANAIADIANTQSTVYRLRQCSPWFTYYIFTAAVIHVYVASTRKSVRPHLVGRAKVSLAKCMLSLKEMELPWTSAVRSWEVLLGLVDLRDVSMSELTEMGKSLKSTVAVADSERPYRHRDLASRGMSSPPLREVGYGRSSGREDVLHRRNSLSTKEIMDLLRLSRSLQTCQSRPDDKFDCYTPHSGFIKDAVTASYRHQSIHRIYGNTFDFSELGPSQVHMGMERTSRLTPTIGSAAVDGFFEGLNQHSDVFAPQGYHIHNPNLGSLEMPALHELFEPLGGAGENDIKNQDPSGLNSNEHITRADLHLPLPQHYRSQPPFGLEINDDIRHGPLPSLRHLDTGLLSLDNSQLYIPTPPTINDLSRYKADLAAYPTRPS